jgi:hypothetical protein
MHEIADSRGRREDFGIVRFTYDRQLMPLLAETEEFLVSKTPGAVAELKISEPAYAIFLWYDDSSAAGDFAPDLGIGVKSIRAACAEMYESRLSVNDCIWRPQQVVHEQVPCGRFRDAAFISTCNEAYALMLAANETGLPLKDEGELLRPFRSMMHRVANRLNQYKWEDLLDTTGEFVVVSVDRIGYWLAEDLKESMPNEKFQLLQQRGLLCDSE